MERSALLDKENQIGVKPPLQMLDVHFRQAAAAVGCEKTIQTRFQASTLVLRNADWGMVSHRRWNRLSLVRRLATRCPVA